LPQCAQLKFASRPDDNRLKRKITKRSKRLLALEPELQRVVNDLLRPYHRKNSFSGIRDPSSGRYHLIILDTYIQSASLSVIERAGCACGDAS
jgi:hypothetical protein